MSPPKVFISIIIPTCSRPGPLLRCVTSLASQAYPRESFEVIVVDDGGDPPAATSLRNDLIRDLPIVILQQAHQGAAAARANGIAHTQGEVLAFLDDDCTVPPDYLAAIDRVFQAHPETEIVQVGINNPEPANIYGRSWKFTLEEMLKANLHQTSDGRLTCETLGGVLVARREIFTLVAFDPALRRREDADLRYQLQAQDLSVYYEPIIRVSHHERQTLRDFLTQAFGYGRGTFHLRRKWGTIPSPFRYVTFTSWRAFRFLLRTEGVLVGLAIYCVLWLRRDAHLCGLLYERAACEFPGRSVLRWISFSWLLVMAHAILLGQVVFTGRNHGAAPAYTRLKGPLDL